MPTIVALGAVHWLCQKDSVAATWDLNVFAGGLFSVNGSLLGWYKHVHPTYIPNSKSFRNRVIYIYMHKLHKCSACFNRFVLHLASLSARSVLGAARSSLGAFSEAHFRKRCSISACKCAVRSGELTEHLRGTT